MRYTVDGLFRLLEEKGGAAYGGERVTQLAHALQSAELAVEAGDPDSLVIAALMHDIGHLVGKGDEGLAAKGIDARHEASGALVLEQVFGKAVAEPVRLHVDAKRYLCFAEAGYWEALSQGSKTSLQVQGGPFTAAEADSFIKCPHAAEAVTLRRYDDLAKIIGKKTPDLAAFRDRARRLQAHA
ncbi:MAG: HD domain-containing protein [Alphaproteobacteria bacterium]|nr:HD domain-containing protein [Alphaproteobacteria bacterium]